MQYVVIENQGVAEALGMRLMGASSKGQEQIGRFGTGWKYGIAGAMRLCGPFEIHLGEEEVRVDSFPVLLRGQEHREVTLNGQGIGITDQLGKDWEPWMVLREFISNAIDEGGHRVHVHDGPVEPKPDRTQVVLPLGPFDDVVAHLDDYFCLFSYEGEVVTPQGRALPKRDPNKVSIFKKGVLVRRVESASAFDYELNDLPLGEDRMAGDVGPWLWAFLDSGPIEVKRQVIAHRFEARSYPYTQPKAGWREVFGDRLVVSSPHGANDELVVAHQFVEVAERVGARTLKSDLSAKAAQRETMPATLTVRQACTKLSRIGVDIDPRVVLMAKLDQAVLVEKGLIYLSKELGPDEVYEALLIAATATCSYATDEQVSKLAAIVRRLARA